MPKLTIHCTLCANTFEVYPYRKNALFCSRKCKGDSMKGYIPWNKGLTKDDDERLMIVSEKAREQMKREYADGTRDRFEITKKANETLRQKTLDKFNRGVPNRMIGKRGYALIYLPKKGWYLEHHWVWECFHGRKIPNKYHVHHINGDPLDNRIGNLELMSASEHGKHHYTERVKAGLIDIDGRFL